MRRINRRTFVLGVTALATGAAPAARATNPFPFLLGVASGEPASDSVLLWTRLARSPLDADGHGGMPRRDIDVDWQLSTQDTFETTIASGTATARFEDAHALRVEAGGLAPDSEYFYRFRAEGHLSPVGRTRTAPAPGTPGRDLTMCFTSCADWQWGYFTVYQRIAEDRPDLILHLGDYIYEYGARADRTRMHLGDECKTLAEYRVRYAQYRTDPDLQAAHAIAPWIAVADDHEVEDDYASLTDADTAALSGERFWQRRAAAYRAYYENMPLRPHAAPSGADMAMHRRVGWGTLATFHMLDTRQHRDPQACGNTWGACPDAADPARSILGTAQEQWLLDGLAGATARWNLIGQQVFFAQRLDATGAQDMDAWDGYPASRARLNEGWMQRGVTHPVVLTGNVHRAYASNLLADYDNPASTILGTELVTSSVTSGGNGGGSMHRTEPIPNAELNPHLKFFSRRRGYVRTRIGMDSMAVDFRGVPIVTEPGAPAHTLASFSLDPRQPGMP